MLLCLAECDAPRTAETEATLLSCFAVCEVLDVVLAAKFGTADFERTWMRLEAATMMLLEPPCIQDRLRRLAACRSS